MKLAFRRFGIGSLMLIILACWTSPIVAATCTDDDWQPSLVYDFDNHDGVYYVTKSGEFQKLQWRPESGYRSAVCSVVRGPQDLRDSRDFTTCEEYTRFQCGCSREVPGNSTCAAFLKWHPAAAEPPETSVAVAASVSLAPESWQQAAQYRAPVTASAKGLILGGGAWTNGRLQNGVYDGNRIYSRQVFDFSKGGDGYMRFAVNAGGQYMNIWPRLLEHVSVGSLTTHHSWANSVVIPENTSIFTHLKVNPDGSYRITASLGNYDDAGGKVITEGNGRLATSRGRLDLQFSDNYAGVAVSVTIAEVKIAIAADQ